jgi:hypothetical protein
MTRIVLAVGDLGMDRADYAGLNVRYEIGALTVETVA